MKLSSRLTIYLSIIFIAFITIFTSLFIVIFSYHAQNVENTRTETKLLNMADYIGKNYNGKDITKSFGNKFFKLSNTLDDGEFWLVDKESLNITGSQYYPKLVYNQLPSTAAKDIQQIFQGKQVASNNFTPFLKNISNTIGVPIKDDSGHIIGALLIHYKELSIFSSWYDYIGIVIFTALGLSILFSLFIYLFVKRYTIPLKIFNIYITKLLNKEYNHKLNIKNAYDFEILANNLNMLNEFLIRDKENKELSIRKNQSLLLNSAYASYKILRDFDNNLENAVPYLKKYLPKDIANRFFVFKNRLICLSENLYLNKNPNLLNLSPKNLELISIVDETIVNFKNKYPNSSVNIDEKLKKIAIVGYFDFYRVTELITSILYILKNSSKSITIDYMDRGNSHILIFESDSLESSQNNKRLHLFYLNAKTLAKIQGLDLKFDEEKNIYKFIIPK